VVIEEGRDLLDRRGRAGGGERVGDEVAGVLVAEVYAEARYGGVGRALSRKLVTATPLGV
jgi:hypothetical protein